MSTPQPFQLLEVPEYGQQQIAEQMLRARVDDLSRRQAHNLWQRDRDMARVEALERFANDAIRRERNAWRVVWVWLACGGILMTGLQGVMVWWVTHGQ